jgi:hypothetical protein
MDCVPAGGTNVLDRSGALSVKAMFMATGNARGMPRVQKVRYTSKIYREYVPLFQFETIGRFKMNCPIRHG